MAGRADTNRPARYALVSIVAGGLAQAGLLLAYAVFGWGTTAASIFSLAVSVGPSYWGSRAYVWQGVTGHRRRREVTSFVVVAVLGTTAAVAFTAATHHLGQLATDNRAFLSAWVTAGSVLATVVVWLTRYLVLDRFVFPETA